MLNRDWHGHDILQDYRPTTLQPVETTKKAKLLKMAVLRGNRFEQIVITITTIINN